MYRHERLGFRFNVQISQALQAELRAVAASVMMRPSQFARRLWQAGLDECRRVGARRYGRMAQVFAMERTGVLLTVQITEETRAAFRAVSEQASMTQSELARAFLRDGLNAWQAGRAPKRRRVGGG